MGSTCHRMISRRKRNNLIQSANRRGQADTRTSRDSPKASDKSQLNFWRNYLWEIFGEGFLKTVGVC
jgi:hypothetical protein